MNNDGLASATRFLVLSLSVFFLAAALGGLALFDFDTTRDRVLWVGFLGVGAALMLFGQLKLPRSSRSAAVVSLGAILGGVPLFWTLVIPIAVAAVIACSFALARGPARA
jgi:hypothetical protein